MDIDWLEPLASRWRRQAQQGRAPHAVLLLGAPGTGKRCRSTRSSGPCTPISTG